MRPLDLLQNDGADEVGAFYFSRLVWSTTSSGMERLR